MRSKAFILAAMLIVGSWLVLKLTQNNTRYKIAINRLSQISALRKELGEITESMQNSTQESVTMADLHSITEIVRLEGQIRDLHTENVIDLSRSHENTYPEFLPILFLAFLSIQIGMLDKKLKTKEETESLNYQ